MTDHLIELDMDWHDALPPEGRLHMQHWARGLPDAGPQWRHVDGMPAVYGVRVDPDDPNRGEILLSHAVLAVDDEQTQEWIPTRWSRPFPMAFVNSARSSTALLNAPGLRHPHGRPLDDASQLQRRVEALQLVVAALVIRGSTESLSAQPAIEADLSAADFAAVPPRFAVTIYERDAGPGAATVRVSRPVLN